ncbi:ABC transporter ATP-binding protein [Cohnella sp. 56]|uniref:ABC transporter ATP-binding protein n=1 Tax=Cohnella sp. 56 TaxID=3113722 RepID=UPI0030E920A8
MNPILEIRQLHKSYAGQPALRGIDFSVSRGQIISVLGPSGCGKSTLLQLIAGLQQPDGGEIRLRGEAVSTATRLVPPEKRGINMVFQDYALWPHMNVFENIAYGLKRKRTSAADIRTKVEELLRLLHLTPLADRLPAQLSGGQQQRVAMARALATQPDLLLLDEPMSNLDMRLRIEMRTELSYLLRRLGTTVFHVTHDPEEAFAMADRLVIMRSGGIDQIDSPEACYRGPATASVASLLGAGNRLAGRVAEEEAAPAVRTEAAVLRGRTAADWSGRQSAGPAIALFRPDAAAWETADVQAGELLAAAELAASAEPIVSDARQTCAAGAFNRLAARIAHSAFEGNRWRVLAELESGVLLSLFHHEPLKAGTRGWLRIPVDETYLYPAPAGSER